MSRRNVSVVMTAALLTAFLLTTSHGQAGEHVRAGNQVIIQTLPAPAFVARPAPGPVSISITMAGAPATATNEAAYVNLRGPDGQLRRFAVVGGPQALSSRVIVLRPGESLSIQWVAHK